MNTAGVRGYSLELRIRIVALVLGGASPDEAAKHFSVHVDTVKSYKAALLRQVLAECSGARFVRTSNAAENTAMLGINVALGFEPFSEQIEWQLHLV